MGDFEAYPGSGYNLYEVEGDLGQVTLPSQEVPMVTTPALTILQKVESFFRTPFGFILIVGGGLYLAHRLGYLNLKKMLQTEESD